jgi:hypothetical protein
VIRIIETATRRQEWAIVELCRRSSHTTMEVTAASTIIRRELLFGARFREVADSSFTTEALLLEHAA